MNKIFSILILITTTLMAQNNLKYMDESKFDYWDLRVFVGVDGGYNYNWANENLDDIVSSTSKYIGIPIYNVELILKDKLSRAKQYDIDSQSITINIPYDGTFAKQRYFGLVYGKGEMKYNNKAIDKYAINKKINNGSYYGFHFGQRNKKTRDLFFRYELEFLTYDMKAKTATGAVELNYSVEFLIGIEYRF